MNVAMLDFVPPDNLPLFPKTELEGTDLFSILMASISVGSPVNQNVYTVTAGVGGGGAGEPDLSAISREISGQDKVPGFHIPDGGAVVVDSVNGLPQIPAAAPDAGPERTNPAGDAPPFLRDEGFTGRLQLSDLKTREGLSDVAWEFTDREAVYLPDAAYDKGIEDIPGNKTLGDEEVGLINRLQDGVKKIPVESLKVFSQTVLPLITAGYGGLKTGISERYLVPPDSGSASLSPVTQQLLPQAVNGIKTSEGMKEDFSHNGEETVFHEKEEVVTFMEAGRKTEMPTVFVRESVESDLLRGSERPVVVGEKGISSYHALQADHSDVVSQVAGKIRADFKDGGGEVRMELHPESLGHVKIEVRVEGGTVRANILAENTMVKDIIDANLSMLKTSLEDLGLRVDQISVGIDHHHAGNSFAERNDPQSWRGFENGETLKHENEGPVMERGYRTDHWNEQGVSIFA